MLPPAYYRVVGANGLANVADGIRSAAFPLLAAGLTGSKTLIALVFAAAKPPGPLWGCGQANLSTAWIGGCWFS